VNGHEAGCLPGTQPFAGACWQSSASETALSAPAAASSCATQGGSLPEALQLATFAQQPGVNLDKGDEWSSDIPVVSAPGLYGVVTVAASGEVAFTASTNTRKFRCVIPLLR
jgi:predicted RNase H-like HicB family nuclease